MPYLSVGENLRLFYKDWGAGQPVVLVHGWCINCDSWEYVARDLAERGFRVIAYDLRGCGRSEQPWDGYDYDTLADDLDALLSQLALRDVVLVGHSMAGGIITRYLVRHGEVRVRRAVLIGTTTPFTLKTADNPDGIDRTCFDGMVAAIQTDRPRYVADLAPGFFGADLGETVSPDLIRWGIDLTLQASARAAVGLLRANTETDQRGELTGITTPTLLLHGDRDGSCPLALTAQRTQALLPNCRLTVYENRAHGIYITDAPRIVEDIVRFIEEPR